MTAPAFNLGPQVDRELHEAAVAILGDPEAVARVYFRRGVDAANAFAKRIVEEHAAKAAPVVEEPAAKASPKKRKGA